MEDILAIVVILLLVGAFWVFLSKLIEWRQQKDAEELAERKRQLEATRQWREKLNTAMNAPVAKTATPTASKSKTTVSTPTYVPSPTQSVQRSNDDDGFVSGMLTGMLIDNVVNSITHKSGGSNPIDFPASSAGVSKSESSWGFDDSDSRKSISDSMDTSSSWSSSSSDSWSSSSSDSGPSSDW